MLNSVWAETARIPAFPPLEGDTRTDVLIVGGGMAGLLCAYLLKRAGVDCLLVEAGRICGGISRNTTAKLTSQHGLCYDKLLKSLGAEKARLYWQANEAALAQYEALTAAQQDMVSATAVAAAQKIVLVDTQDASAA